MKKYLTDVIQLSESTAEIAFVVTCVTAPLLGILVGGLILQRLGGYQKISALYIVLINSLCCGLLAISAAFTTNSIAVGFILWTYLFLGAMIDPCILGSLLASLPLELKGSGYSLQYIASSIIGVSSAPFLYGFIHEHTKNTLPTLAMSICLSFPLIASLLVFLVIRDKRRAGYAMNSDIDCSPSELIKNEGKNINDLL
jgi:MFS family permease